MTGTYNGYERDGKTVAQGGYASAIVVNEDYVLHLPENLEMAGIAPLLCAGITLYSPLKHWGAGPGKKVGIDYETIFNITIYYSIVCFVDFISFDDFNIANNVVFTSKIKHFLCLFHATNHGTSNSSSLVQHGESINWIWFAT